MSREMVIYWYTIKSERFGDIKPGVTYCIGEADPYADKYVGLSVENIAKTRIKEELGKLKSGAHITFSDITDLNYRCVDFPNPNGKLRGMDKDIHAVLKNIGCKQISTEWFNTTSDEISRVIEHIEFGTSIGTTYTLRKRQAEALDKFKLACSKHEKKFGLFAMPRFGKTICSFEMMNCLFEMYPDKKYIFFISAKLDAEQALREDYYKFDKSCNFKLHLYDSDNNISKTDLQNNKYVFFASKQWFDGKSLKEIQEKFPGVNDNDCAGVFFDEAHFARMTENSQRTISLLNPVMQIDITGTPFRLKTNEDYNDDNSYVYSVLDEFEDFEKSDDKEKFRINNPEMVYITPENEFFKTDNNFAEFFDSDNCKTEIKKWVKKTFYGGKFNINGNVLDIRNAIIVLPPRKKYCDLFDSCVKEIATEEKLSIKSTKTTTKDEKDEDYISNNQDRFNKWNYDCKTETDSFHLLITIGKGLQSVSFPDCHAVIMLCDMTSPEQYVQSAFRSKTPNDEKKEAYVIDYNKGRTLQIIDTFIKNHLYVRACDSNYKREYERALSAINIRDHTLVRHNYTFEEIFQTFVSNWNIEKITDNVDFDFEKLVERIDLSEVNINDLAKPYHLELKLTDRGEDYEESVEVEITTDGENLDEGSEGNLGEDDEKELEKQRIEELKEELVKKGYIPFGGKDEDRLTNINKLEIKERWLKIGSNVEKEFVWSYMGGEGNLDDIYIDTSSNIPSLFRWKYVINNKYVNIGGVGTHDRGKVDIKKARAFVNAIVRYLPAYFLCSGRPVDFEGLANRFGRQSVAEKFKERQFFRDFMGKSIDYRYMLDVLRVCDAGSREQVLSFCNSKLDKCFDKSGNLIPSEVLKLLFIYKKDGSRPVPFELAQKMRNNKNYEVVICGGYWLTDDTTKLYITDSFSEAHILKKLRPNCEVIYSKDILETLEKGKEKIMQFTSFIMNPPYGNLHLPILKTMVELIVENGGYGVSLQPVRWLQDPLKEYKQGTDYKKYKDYLNGNIISIYTLVSMECSKIFDALFAMDLGIFELKKNSEFELSDCYKDDLLMKILSQITNTNLEHSVINDKMEKNKRLGIRVKVNDIQGNGIGEKGPSKNRIGKYKVFISVDGFINGKDWTECVQKNQFSKDIGSPIPYSIEFKSVKEADNFVKSTETMFFQYLLVKMHRDINVPNQWLPFMNDYTEPWTDERFYEYFGITDEEQKIIEKTVADAKK